VSSPTGTVTTISKESSPEEHTEGSQAAALVGWYIPGHQLSSGLVSSALPGCMTRTNHLKFGNMRE
jgi:hypothetical protein